MRRYVYINNKKIEYELSIKNVKNINMRIKQDCNIYVSANRHIPYEMIDDFVISKSNFIYNAFNKYMTKQNPKTYFNDDELIKYITHYCKKIYPHFEKKGVTYPIIKFRNMKTRWGCCNYLKGIVTFNTKLKFVPNECVEYIVLHEFTHFLQPNHSKLFYDELSKVCPKWKEYRKKLKDILI